jgi:hypothetical protein
MTVTTGRVLVGTRPVASLHTRSMTEDIAETTAIYMASSVPEMHVAKLKADVEIGRVKNKNSARKGTMIIMVLTMTDLTESGHQKRDTSQEASRHTP